MVTLKVVYAKYERYTDGGVHTKLVHGKTLLDALKTMVSNMGLYLAKDDIENDEMLAEEVIEQLKQENGDGCDFIMLLKDVNSEEVYIKEDYNEEEIWG